MREKYELADQSSVRRECELPETELDGVVGGGFNAFVNFGDIKGERDFHVSP